MAWPRRICSGISPDGAAPAAGYDGSRQWLEGFITPSIAFSGPLSRGWRLEGRASVLASGTWGSDAFAAGDTARVDLEEAWVAFERGGEGADPRVRLSLGAQPLRLAEGMLVSNGGSNGFERGALKLGPRKAWRDSAVVTLGRSDLTVQSFILSPNEQDSNRTGARLRGLDLTWKASPEWALGGTWIDVMASRSPYPQAALGGLGPPVFLDGARAGLRALHGWANWEPTLAADGAGTVVAGVTDRHLSDDVFLEFNQPLLRQTFLSAGVSVSAPGRGIRQVFPSSDPYWSGAYVTFFYVR